MNEKQKGADLNEPKIEKDVYNRAQEIVRILTESQLLIMRGDMLGDLNSMYHGCQGMLDVVQGDFVERVKEKDGKTHIYKGMKTTKFRKYRQILDQANNLQKLSQGEDIDQEDKMLLRNSAYKKYQYLKYCLLLESDKYGYSARLHNRADTYREGNT